MKQSKFILSHCQEMNVTESTNTNGGSIIGAIVVALATYVVGDIIMNPKSATEAFEEGRSNAPTFESMEM